MPATKITVNSDGSVRVEGDFEILDPMGQAFGLAGRTVIGLCRCGASANRPFCDGSHKRIEFQAPDSAIKPPEPAATTVEPVIKTGEQPG